jgi:hypothetical protein
MSVAAGLIACGTTAASPSGSASATTIVPAPTVSTPITPGTQLANPCSLLTTAQLASLGFIVTTQPQPQTDNTGPQCSWQDAVTYDHLGFVWLVHDTRGLTDLYTGRSGQAYFVPTTVSGYPAVFAATKDERSAGVCTINVGVSDTLMFFVQFVAVGSGRKAGACATAQAAATDMVQTLSAGH